jgi:predicted naringenin-chalcone synthase
MAGVKTRHTVVLGGPEGSPNRQPFFRPPGEDGHQGPSIRARMHKYESDSLPLAVEAAQAALENAESPAGRITHLVTVSCSGFAAPGVDIALIKQLGLAPTVQRTHVGFMGCHGALNGLRVARALTESDPSARVLLCAVELCSLHYHYGWNNEQLVANALFADGAAAIVGEAQPRAEGGAWSIAATGSCVIPDSEDAMTWRIGDNGFEMSLSARVPELIGTHLRGWLETWLAENGLALGDVQSWAVHPGGPRILGSVVKALELDRDAVAVSREILQNHGNMSSPTLLFILQRLRQSDAPRPCVALGFGPGLVAEATLFS